MTELTQSSPTKKQRLKNLGRNPVTVKELRSRMRGRKAFVVLTVYLLVMSLFILLIYAAFSAGSNDPFGPNARDVGKAIFAAIVGVQAFLVVFVGPAYTASAISGEKERQTYDLLRTTLLTAKRFVSGKLFSSLAYVFLLILAAIPLQSIAFLLGGVSFLELLVSQIVLLAAAVSFAMWGLFCSASFRSTMAASVATFGGALFVTLITPMLAGLGLAIVSPFLALSATLSWVGEAALAYTMALLAATNLPAALITSEIFFLDDGAIFLYKQSFSGHTVYLPSPWLPFALLYSLLAFLLYWLTVRKVRKTANR